jgi:hypothetical protein
VTTKGLLRHGWYNRRFVARGELKWRLDDVALEQFLHASPVSSTLTCCPPIFTWTVVNSCVGRR